MKNVIPAAIAIGVGLVTLLGFFFTGGELIALRLVFTEWAIVLGALAVLLGLLNLLRVHARRIDARAPGWPYSILTVLAAVVTLAIGLVEGGPALYGESSLTTLLFNGVLLASQAALASLVMFFLVAAAVRMLRSNVTPWSVGFLAVVVIVLVGWLPLSFLSPVNQLREWLLRVPVAAGARGILLGVALGTITIGLRVLSGAERPYKD
jgi:hypothetical protein